MSLPTLPVACRASSVITFVPASLYKEAGNASIQWRLLLSFDGDGKQTDSHTWKNPQNPCGPNFVDRTHSNPPGLLILRGSERPDKQWGLSAL